MLASSRIDLMLKFMNFINDGMSSLKGMKRCSSDVVFAWFVCHGLEQEELFGKN